MPTITKEEYARRVIEFIEAHKEDYTDREIDFIKRHASWGLDKPYVADILRQIYNEVGAMDDDINMYQGFINLLEKNFDINTDIIEFGGGIIPSLAKKLSLKQKSGTITVYDPRIITSIEHADNLILKKEQFNENTPIGNTKLIIGFMPCDSTNMLIDIACKNNLDFMIALCEGGMRPGYEWLETDEEWINHVKINAEMGMRGRNMGKLAVGSLTQYENPFPVIYNKKS